MPTYNQEQGRKLWQSYSEGKIKLDDLSHKGQKALLEYGVDTGMINPKNLAPGVLDRYSVGDSYENTSIAPPSNSLADRAKNTFTGALNTVRNMFGSRETAPSPVLEPTPSITPRVDAPKLNTGVDVSPVDSTIANNHLLNSLGKLLPQPVVSERPERQQGPANRSGTLKPQIEMPKFSFINPNPDINLPTRLHEKIETGEVKPKLQIGDYTLFDSSIDKEAERLQLIEADKVRAEKEKEARDIRKKYKIEQLIDDGRADLIEKGWNINGAWMVANPTAAKSLAKIMKPLDTVFDSDVAARIGQKATDTMLGRKTPDELKPSTDNKALDIVSDIAGSIGGLSTPLPGMGNSIYDLSRNVSSPVGNKVAENMANRLMPKLGQELTEEAISKIGISRAIDLMNISNSKKFGYQLLFKGVPSTARTIASLGTIQAIEEARSDNKLDEKLKNIGSSMLVGAGIGAIGSLVGTSVGEAGKHIKANKIKGISLNAFDKESLVSDGYKKIKPGIWGLEKDGKISDVVVEGVLSKGEIVPVTSLSTKELNNALKQGTNTITKYHIGFNTSDGLSEVLTKSGYEKVPGRNDTFINPKTGEIRVLGTKEGADFIPMDHAGDKIDKVRESLNRQGINYSAANQDVKILEPVNKQGWRIAVRNKANEMYTKRLADQGYKEAKNGIWQLTDNNGKVVDVIYEYAYTGKANPVPAFRLESLIPRDKGTKHIIDYMEKEIYKNSAPGNAKTQIEEVLPMDRLMEVNPGVGNKLFENMVKLETLPREAVNKALKSKEFVNALNMLKEEVTPNVMESMFPLALEKGAIVFNEVIKKVLPEINNVKSEDLKSIQDWNRELQSGKVSQTTIENAPTEFLVDFLDDIHYAEHRNLQEAVLDELNLRGYKDVMNKKNAPSEVVAPINTELPESLNQGLENTSIPNVLNEEIKAEFEPVVKPEIENKVATPREINVGDVVNFEGSEYKIKSTDGENFTAVNTKTGETGFLPKGDDLLEHYKHIENRNNDIPMEDRAFENVGDKKVKAYQYNNPEVKPFYQTRAKELLKDLSDTVKGDRIPVKDDEGYIIDYMGQPRVTSEDIGRIKDITGASYEKIKDALERIVKDEGAENIALAKKIELVIDDNLTKGYQTFGGMEIGPNEDYINIRNEIENVKNPENLQVDNNVFKGDLPNPVEEGTEFTNQMTIAIPNEQASVFDSPATVVKPETETITGEVANKSEVEETEVQTEGGLVQYDNIINDTTLSDYNIQVNEAKTGKGTPVWHVVGDTKEHSKVFGKDGLKGMWYGPKKAWSFSKKQYDTKEKLEKAILEKLPKIEVNKEVVDSTNNSTNVNTNTTTNPSTDNIINSSSDPSTKTTKDKSEEVLDTKEETNKDNANSNVVEDEIEKGGEENERADNREETNEVGQGDTKKPEGSQPETIRGADKDRGTESGNSIEAGTSREDGGSAREEAQKTDEDLRDRRLSKEVPSRDDVSTADKRDSKSRGSDEVRGNYRITEADQLGKGSIKQKYKHNIEAIKIVKELESEGRAATIEEQQKLVKYVGWGGIPQVFNEVEYRKDKDSFKWKKEYEELKSLLTDEEYTLARSTVRNAHYTSKKIIDNIYAAIEQLGFKKGKVIEPGMGIGNFFGLVPDSLVNKVNFTGIEMDSMTGRIAKLLYPSANVLINKYQDVNLPDNYFDVAVGNVPFADTIIKNDSKYKNFYLHDYFFAKTLDKIKPGGVMGLITSKGTMDKKDSTFRKYMAEKAELVGAIRLPNTAFKENANTEVTTDILFFRKLEEGQSPSGESFISLGEIDGVPVNEYFSNNPKMLLGTMKKGSNMYGNEDETYLEADERDLKEALKEAINLLPKDIFKAKENKATQPIAFEEAFRETEKLKEYQIIVKDNVAYQYEDGKLNPLDFTGKPLERIKGLINVRSAVREVLTSQVKNLPEAELLKNRHNLNKVYDAFVKEHGYIHARGNKLAFREDPDYPLLLTLERQDPNNEDKFIKAAIFSKRTIAFPKPVESVNTVEEALNVTLNENGFFDKDHVASLLDKPVNEVIDELINKDLIYKNPVGEYEFKEEYLSGNVRIKLNQAREAAKDNPEYERNVTALEKVQPAPVKAYQIQYQLGSPWIPDKYITDFANELFKEDSIKATYSPGNSTWYIDGKLSYSSVANTQTYGLNRTGARGIDLLEKALNGKEVNLTQTIDGERIPDPKATTLARTKMEEIRQKFYDWLLKDTARRDDVMNIYNERFNSIRARAIDGSYLTLPGMNPAITLRNHQKDAIARVLQKGNTLLYHVVGAGKTFTMIGAGMEMKRLGLVNKPMYVVPNHLVEQWAKDIYLLYPNANILVATKKDFEKKKRQQFISKIATGDWDAVVIAHSSFGMIPVSKETQKGHIEKQINDIREAIIAAKMQEDKADSKVVKQLEAMADNLSEKLDALLNTPKDDVVTFEELGVDQIFLDEAHEFKNLYLYTKKGRVAGIPSGGSAKASDLYMKTQYVSKLHNDKRGVVFATGTAISNTMAEMYTMQKYLQEKTLEDMGLIHFDSWADTFGETVEQMELAPEGKGFRTKKRFSRFYNLPEMMSIFLEVADIKTSKFLNLPVPKLKGGKPTIVKVPSSDLLREYVESLIERSGAVKDKRVDPSEDNMLKITNDGRNAAIDMRLIDPSFPDIAVSKINVAVDNVFKTWKKSAKFKGTQLIFSDLGTPKTGKEKNKSDDEEAEFEVNFDIYNDIREKLIKKGIPKDQIAFIHEANTDAQKEALFKNVRSGKVRVLLGSTKKMGAGMNVQDKLIALHHLDAPWKPSDVEQREGRILRQGNENAEVEVFRYVTEESFDAYIWQLLENKARFIGQVLNYNPELREVEDLDEIVLQASEAKAAASGNPLIMEKAEVDNEAAKLTMLKGSYRQSVFEMQDNIKNLEEFTIPLYEGLVKDSQEDIKKLKDTTGKNFTITLNNKSFIERKEAGEYLEKILTEHKKKDVSEISKEVKVGSLGGLDLYFKYKFDKKNFDLILKGKGDYKIEKTASPTGTIISLENKLKDIPKSLEKLQKNIESKKKELKDLKEEVKKPFKHEERLGELQKRQKELMKLLSDEKPTEEEVDFETKTRQKQKDEKGPKIGIVSDPGLFNGPGNNFNFTDPEVGERFKASHGLKPESRKDKLKETLDVLWKQVTRDFENLPNDPQFEEARFALRKLKAQKDVANDKTLLYMREITNNIESPEERFQFEVKVVLDNLIENMKNGQGLAFGYTEETLIEDHEKITEMVENSPYLKEAVETRKAAWNDIKENYIVAMNGIGFDVGDKLQRENYFRQQVLEYSQLKKVTGTGQKLKTPTYRGYLKQRKGGYDFNTNYLEAEYEVMSQMIYDTEIARTLKRIKDKYDIAPKLRSEAKKLTDEAMAPIKKKIKKDLEAGAITKEQSEELKRLAKAEFGTNWKDLIPEGYTEWQPREGNMFYRTRPVTGDLAEMIFENMGADLKKIKDANVKAAIEELLDTLNKQKSTLALGNKYTEYIIPIELSETLDKLTTTKDAGPLGKFFNDNIYKSLNAWKAYQLMAPRRAFKYNIRNISGDAEAAALGNPSVFKKVPEAAKEVYSVFGKKEPVTGEMHQWFVRGGMQSLLEVQEIGDVNELEIFAKIQNQEKTIKAIPKNMAMLYWKNVRLATESREAILRYAAYLDYLEQMKESPNGLPKNYGASDPERVKALDDIRDRAYKLSNELLGAYDSISVMGQDIRKYLIPFWSFQEVNFKRYIQLFKNASYVDFDNVDEDGKLVGAGGKGKNKNKFKIGATFGARMAAKFIVKAAMLNSLLFAYNNLFFPDEEKELSMDIRRSPHIILGRNAKGEVMYFTQLGVLDDFLGWFGLETLPYDAKDFLNGKKTLKEIAENIVKAPTNKVVNGLTPLIKLPTELITKKNTFPDVFSPSNIRDPWLHLAQGISLGDEYKALTKKPGKSYRDSIADIFVYRAEENKNAYYDMYSIKDDFLKKNNKALYQGSASTDDKSMALYYVKQSLYHGDAESFKKYLYEYYSNGGTAKGINQSLENLHPLSGISKKDRGAFLKSLDEEEKETLDKAINYYNDVIVGNVKKFNKK